MRRYIATFIVTLMLVVGMAMPVFAHGGEEEAAFDAETNVKQAIVTLQQRQPNVGVIEMKLTEILENEAESGSVIITKVEKALDLVQEGNYKTAEALLQESIREAPEQNSSPLGSPLAEYEKEFSPDNATYLLLASAIFFVGIGGLILKQSVRG